MNIEDITIDAAPFKWGEILEDWFWLLPPEFDVWLVTKFGDLFCHLPDDSIHWLDTGAGLFTKVADTREDFFQKADIPENVGQWFMPPLLSRMKTKGVELTPQECYSFSLLPSLGGKYEEENLKPCDLSVHLAITGQIFFNLKDTPDGTKVRFTIAKGEA